MGKLKDRMRDDLRLRNYAPGTVDTYLSYAKRFVARFMKPPEEITRDESRAYLLRLLTEREFAVEGAAPPGDESRLVLYTPDSLRQILCADRFSFESARGR